MEGVVGSAGQIVVLGCIVPEPVRVEVGAVEPAHDEVGCLACYLTYC